MKTKKRNGILKNLGVTKVLTTGILSLLLSCIGIISTFAETNTDISSENLSASASNLSIINVLGEAHMTAFKDNQNQLILDGQGSSNKLNHFFGMNELAFVSDTTTSGDATGLHFLTRNPNAPSMDAGRWKLWHTDKFNWTSVPLTDSNAPSKDICDQIVLSRYGSKLMFVYDKQINIYNVDSDEKEITPFDTIKIDDTDKENITPNSVYTNDGQTIVYSTTPDDNYAKAISDDGTRMITPAANNEGKPMLFTWKSNGGWANGDGKDDSYRGSPLWFENRGSSLCRTANDLDKITVHYDCYIPFRGYVWCRYNLRIGDGRIINHEDRQGDVDDNLFDAIDTGGQMYQMSKNSCDFTNWQFPIVGNWDQTGRTIPIMPLRPDLSSTALLPSLDIKFQNSLSFATPPTTNKYTPYNTTISPDGDGKKQIILWVLKSTSSPNL